MSSKPRRSHPKSRTGCKTCKSRKIKCDETRPSCRNCGKHGVKCDFLAQETAYNSPSSASLPGDAPGDNGGFGGGGGLNVVDLELLHNFCTSTYSTLSNDPLLRTLWKTTVVQISFSCDYVLRTLLAVSALHLAHHRPQKRDDYISRALLYHQVASRVAITELSNVSEGNAQYLQLFSTLTIFFALGSPRRPGGFLLVGESSFPDWMFLLSGSRYVSEIALDSLFKGPLGPMYHHGRRRWLFQQLLGDSSNEENPGGEEQSPPPREIQALENLRRLLEGNITDPENRPAYLNAVKELRPTFRLILGGRYPETSPQAQSQSESQSQSQSQSSIMTAAAAGTIDLTDAFIWMYKIANEFFPLLRIPTQEAVAIFAHFCVLLKRLENQWWLNGWADHLISKAYHLLDDEHRLWIQWPIEEIGWLPPLPPVV